MDDQAEDQMLTYPTDKVVGIAPDHDTLEAVREALRASNIDDDRVDVLSSRNTPDDEPLEDGEHGALASAVRVVRNALGEEAPRLRALNEALDRGEFVVQVEVAREDGDIIEDDKRAIGDAFTDAGAGTVAFYGALAVEDLQIQS